MRQIQLPPTQMKHSLDNVNETARAKFGDTLWRPVPKDLEPQFQSLMEPLSDDRSALISPLLVLSKVFVDALNSRLLKSLVNEVEKHEKSLSLLKKLLDTLGDETDCSKVLRDLFAVRSRAGIAHLSNSESQATLEKLGIDGRSPKDAFFVIIDRLNVALLTINKLLMESDPGSVRKG